MSHVRRIAIAIVFLFATFILGLVLDTVMPELWSVVNQFNVSSGPFGAVLPHIKGVEAIVVPILLVGVCLWVIWGSIQEERREEERRRIRP